MRRQKSLGQIFTDKQILEKEVSLLDLKGKTVLEIGAGDGRLTKLLAGEAKKVIAVEKDPRFFDLLKSIFSGKKNVEFYNIDILEYGIPKVDYIFGNLPYNLSSPIISKLTACDFDIAIIMVQDEFAKRMAAEPKSRAFSRISFMSQFFFDVKYIQKVSKNHFKPVPKVDSAILMLTNKRSKIGPSTKKVISCLFNHRKKTIRKALIAIRGELGISKEKTYVIADSLPHSKERIYKLGIHDILEVGKRISDSLESD